MLSYYAILQVDPVLVCSSCRDGALHKVPMQQVIMVVFEHICPAPLSPGNVYAAPAHAAKKRVGGPLGLVVRMVFWQIWPSISLSHGIPSVRDRLGSHIR
jgi:hypothetical protein